MVQQIVNQATLADVPINTWRHTVAYLLHELHDFFLRQFGFAVCARNKKYKNEENKLFKVKKNKINETILF